MVGGGELVRVEVIAEVFGLDRITGDLPVLEFGHAGRRGDADFVHAVVGVHHHHVVAAELLQYPRHRFDQIADPLARWQAKQGHQASLFDWPRCITA